MMIKLLPVRSFLFSLSFLLLLSFSLGPIEFN